jgi:hypothetical protein
MDEPRSTRRNSWISDRTTKTRIIEHFPQPEESVPVNAVFDVLSYS